MSFGTKFWKLHLEQEMAGTHFRCRVMRSLFGKRVGILVMLPAV